MSWYYAGPEATPIGPITVEELHALRAAGTITPETFVIEHTGPGAANLAWRRYRELFPAGTPPPTALAHPAPLPAIPGAPPVVAPYAPQPVTTLPAPGVPVTAAGAHVHPPAPPVPAATLPPGAVPHPMPGVGPHPLFPSAGVSHPAPPSTGGGRPTNAWCLWGFVLGIVGFFSAFACGIGIIPALIGGLLCIVGLAQISAHRGAQSGVALAWVGLGFCVIALGISLFFIVLIDYPILKAHGLTVTEETSNDSE
ncbi:MAG: hypothetical protein WDO13_12905 [Verrucomicrobiota bacterium]